MPDIFDQITEPKAPKQDIFDTISAEGDIFDKITVPDLPPDIEVYRRDVAVGVRTRYRPTQMTPDLRAITPPERKPTITPTPSIPGLPTPEEEALEAPYVDPVTVAVSVFSGGVVQGVRAGAPLLKSVGQAGLQALLGATTEVPIGQAADLIAEEHPYAALPFAVVAGMISGVGEQKAATMLYNKVTHALAKSGVNPTEDLVNATVKKVKVAIDKGKPEDADRIVRNLATVEVPKPKVTVPVAEPPVRKVTPKVKKVKPVKDIFDKIEQPPTLPTTLEARQEALRAMRARGEAVRAAKAIEKPPRKFSLRVKKSIMDTNAPVIRKVKEAVRAGKKISPEENPIYAFEEARYTASQQKEYLQEIQIDFNKTLKKLIPDDKDLQVLDDIMFHERVMFERTEIKNPLGFTPETSAKQIDKLKSDLGDKYKTYRNAVEKFRSIRKKDVIPELEKEGMFSDDLISKIKENDHYATFNVIDYAEKEVGSFSGISAQILKQYGTLKEVESPFTATILKDLALLRAVNRNKAVRLTTKFMQAHFPDEITNAELRFNGKTKVPVEPKDPELGLMRYMEKGKVKGYYVDKYIAEVFNRSSAGDSLTASILSVPNRFFKEIFVGANPGFWMFNLMRDYRRAWINLPGMKIPGSQWAKFAPEYLRAIKPAFREAYGIPTDVVREMNKGNMMITVANWRGLRPEDMEVERLLHKYHLSTKEWNNRITKPFKGLWDKWTNIGMGIEKIPKIAGYRYLKKHTNLSDEEIAHMIRGQIGSPDFLRKGDSYNLYNNLFLFSNAIKEGWRSDIEVARTRPAEYAWKRARATFVPKIVMYAGAVGLLGPAIKTLYDGVSEYDMSNYTVIPIMVTESGKSVYLRVPQDETGRFVGGVLWKFLASRKQEDFYNLFDYMAEQAPTLTPTVGLAIDTVQYLFGKNPYDWFRGGYVIPEHVMEAGGVRAHKEFLKHFARGAGANVLYRFPYDDIDRVKSEAEKILDMPVASNIIGRFIKVSDVGVKEKLREPLPEIRRQNARDILAAKDVLTKIVNEKKLTIEDIEALRKKPDIITDNMAKLLTKKYGNAFIEVYLSARSNEEKLAIINRMMELREGK